MNNAPRNYSSKRHTPNLRVEDKITFIRTELEPLFSEMKGSLVPLLPACWIAEPVDLVCLGIGSLCASENSQYQFGFLTLLKELFHVQDQSAWIFDPIMTKSDVELAFKFGFQVPQHNKAGRHHVSKRSVFYMPHCPRALYDNLLLENWNEASLGNLMIIGNSFSHYELFTSTHQMKESMIYRALPHVKEHVIHQPGQGELFAAFNDQSVHIFDSESLQNMSDAFWKDVIEESVQELVT